MGSNLRAMYVATSAQLGTSLIFVQQKSFASNAVEFTGLSGSNQYICYISATAVDATGVNIEINGDTTVGDYTEQSLSANAATVASATANNNLALLVQTGTAAITLEIVRNEAGYATWKSQLNQPASLMLIGGTKLVGTVTEITSFKLLKTSGTSVAGTAKLYKVPVV